jgi:hypothetical protein
MTYKPYSPEWNRKRYLKESLDDYFDNNVTNDVIYNDIMDILEERSQKAYKDFIKTMRLEHQFYSYCRHK